MRSILVDQIDALAHSRGVTTSADTLLVTVASEDMTPVVMSCRATDCLLDVLAKMEELGLTHMPVVGVDSKPAGVVNVGDAMRVLMADEKYDAALLRDYVMGIGYH